MGHAAFKLARFTPGERSVIGTPTLFDAARLRSHPFDVEAAHSDDTELCERWARLFDARFAIVDVVVREMGQTDVSSVIDRFTRYGISDAEVHRRNRRDSRRDEEHGACSIRCRPS